MASEVKSVCSDFSVEVSELVALGVVDELKQPQISDLVLGHEGDGLLVHLESEEPVDEHRVVVKLTSIVSSLVCSASS